jgi:uncharacterized DUF497 family protein
LGRTETSANQVKHGLDFADLDEAFVEQAVIVSARSGRQMAVGWLDGLGIVVIHVVYGVEAISVISMRPASVAERKVL